MLFRSHLYIFLHLPSLTHTHLPFIFSHHPSFPHLLPSPLFIYITIPLFPLLLYTSFYYISLSIHHFLLSTFTSSPFTFPLPHFPHLYFLFLIYSPFNNTHNLHYITSPIYSLLIHHLQLSSLPKYLYLKNNFKSYPPYISFTLFYKTFHFFLSPLYSS